MKTVRKSVRESVKKVGKSVRESVKTVGKLRESVKTV